jgi:integrative and conjugative element protein (TIGR02256 family)
MGTAWLSTSALTVMRADAELHRTCETGGLLLGYVQDPDVVICDVIGPGPGAQRTDTTFLPDDRWQTEELAERYAASGRSHTYLGDWHTHPAGAGTLSGRDRRTLRRIARARQARIAAPVSLVLVPNSEKETVAVWRYAGRFHRPTRLRLTTFER